MPSVHMKRYVKIGDNLYKMSEHNRKRALEDAVHMGLATVEINLQEYKMTLVSTDVVEDWTYMSSQRAADLLLEKHKEQHG